MTGAAKDGGAAFPQFGRDPWDKLTVRGGMSLRDWFAGQALVGTLANSEGVHCSAEPTLSVLSGDRRLEFAAWLALQAYDIADAMIAARARGTS